MEQVSQWNGRTLIRDYMYCIMFTFHTSHGVVALYALLPLRPRVEISGNPIRSDRRFVVMVMVARPRAEISGNPICSDRRFVVMVMVARPRVEISGNPIRQ